MYKSIYNIYNIYNTSKEKRRRESKVWIKVVRIRINAVVSEINPPPRKDANSNSNFFKF